MPTLPAASCHRPPSIGTRYVTNVGGAACHVRGTTIWPIEEILGLEVESVLMATIDEGMTSETVVGEEHASGVGSLVADLLESRMIVPLRPRRGRGRDRAVSSRAHFFAGNDG